jgi:hypothetical protein
MALLACLVAAPLVLVEGCEAPQLPPPDGHAGSPVGGPRSRAVPCAAWNEADYAGCDPGAEGTAWSVAPSVAADDFATLGQDLRVRADPRRNRLWVLGLDDVRVYDLAGATLLRRIALPPWSVARGLCMPDIALDAGGSAYVAANAQPTVFRIDGVTLESAAREIRLLGREDWSIGFGALAFDAEGALHGLAASGNSRWRIDFERGLAELLQRYDPPLQHCTLAAHSAPPLRSYVLPDVRPAAL